MIPALVELTPIVVQARRPTTRKTLGRPSPGVLIALVITHSAAFGSGMTKHAEGCGNENLLA
jgi:hypothetical protein